VHTVDYNNVMCRIYSCLNNDRCYTILSVVLAAYSSVFNHFFVTPPLMHFGRTKTAQKTRLVAANVVYYRVSIWFGGTPNSFHGTPVEKHWPMIGWLSNNNERIRMMGLKIISQLVDLQNKLVGLVQRSGSL